MDPIQTPPEGTETPFEQPVPVAPEIPVNPDEAPANPDPAQPVDQGQPDEQTPPEPIPATPEGYVPRDKFAASARESILNAERIKVRDAQIDQLTNTDTPTDEAMKLLYPDWDQLNDVTKQALVKQETQEMRQHRLEAQQQTIIDRQKLDDELETVIDGNQKLQGKEAAFKRFAKDPKNRGIPAETLAKAFLYDGEDEAPKAPVTAAPSEALPQGNGGPRDPLTPKKISIEEAIQIKNTDYKRYMELVRDGKIEEIE